MTEESKRVEHHVVPLLRRQRSDGEKERLRPDADRTTKLGRRSTVRAKLRCVDALVDRCRLNAAHERRFAEHAVTRGDRQENLFPETGSIGQPDQRIGRGALPEMIVPEDHRHPAAERRKCCHAKVVRPIDEQSGDIIADLAQALQAGDESK